MQIHSNTNTHEKMNMENAFSMFAFTGGGAHSDKRRFIIYLFMPKKKRRELNGKWNFFHFSPNLTLALCSPRSDSYCSATVNHEQMKLSLGIIAILFMSVSLRRDE